MTKQPAAAGSRTHARKLDADLALIDALENAVATACTVSLVTDLRHRGFSDSYIAAALLAGAKSLIRGLPDRRPFAALLDLMAQEAADGR